MSDEWFAEKIAGDENGEDGIHPDEVQALRQLLRQQISPHEAAVSITKPIEESCDPDSELADLWGLLAEALIELPVENISLVLTLLHSIEDLPPPDFSAAKEIRRPPHGTLWRGLPGFGHYYADVYQSEDWRSTIKDANVDDIRALEIRKAHVEARIVVAGIGTIPIDWGYECVAKALEQTTDDRAVLDIEISAAAEWLEIAGERFRTGAMRAEESWALRCSEGGLWNQGNTMTPERLGFWQRRLDELKSAGIGEATENAPAPADTEKM